MDANQRRIENNQRISNLRQRRRELSHCLNCNDPVDQINPRTKKEYTLCLKCRRNLSKTRMNKNERTFIS